MSATEEIERLCEVMHDAYERAAVGAGWETQQASRKPWSEVPEANKSTMRVAVVALLSALPRVVVSVDSVTPEAIKEQRAKGWPDFHPEDYCHRCGRRNFVWFADSAQWNLAEGGPEGILCPTCFTDDHEKAIGKVCSWRLAPAERSDVVSALTISEAEMRHRLAEVEAELAEVRRAQGGD